MGNCIFPMVNAWVSKKPVKYWRAFAPKDIPLADLKQNSIKYYEWNNDFQMWMLGILYPIERHWSTSNIAKMIDIHSRLIRGGEQGTVIVEVHPKYGIGKYKNIEIINIFSENTQYMSNNTCKVYETEYYIKHKNNVSMIKETELETMMNESNHLFVYTFTGKYEYEFQKQNKDKDIYLHIGSKTNRPSEEIGIIKNIINTPGLKLNFPDCPVFFYNKIIDKSWEHTKTHNISKKIWNLRKEKEPYISYNSENNTFNMYFTFINFKQYYEGQIAKINSSSIKDDLDTAFLNAVKTNRTKTASSLRKVRSSRHKSSLRENLSEVLPKEEKDKVVYIIYTTNKKSVVSNKENIITKCKQHLVIKKNEITLIPTEINRRCPLWQAERLRERHPEIKILTIREYNRMKSDALPKRKKSEVSVIPTEGSFNRKMRRLDKGKNRKNSRLVHTQYISIPIKDTKSAKYPHTLHANVKGDKFITSSSITGAVIKVGNQLVEKDSLKPIYHHVKPDNRIITRHNAEKHNPNLLLELKDKYSSHDRRYTINSDVETWSIQFFIVLKMVKDQIRHKKVVKYLTKVCGHSNEFAEGFIKYLQMTKNGDPTREHKKNPVILYKRIKVTRPHIQVNSPDPRLPLVIEHEVENEEEGGVKNIITEDVYVRYNRKSGLTFFKYNVETNEHIFISNSKSIKKWAYVQEYKEDASKAKWHDLVTVSTKEVDAIQKNKFILDRKVKGSKSKKWITPIPIEKKVKYIIKLLLVHKKNNNDVLLYSVIRNKVMTEYKDCTELYELLRFTLYHDYSDLVKHIVTKIKTHQMDDPDLVTFMEDLMNPHFN